MHGLQGERLSARFLVGGGIIMWPHHLHLVPTFAVAEHSFQAQSATGQVRSVDVPLTVRAIAGLLLGLLTLQLLGDEMIAQRWEELPEVLTTLLFDGLQPGKETTHE